MLPIKYCLSCGCEDVIHEGNYQTEYHLIDSSRYINDICFGPFAETPPPDVPDNWIDPLIELSPEEMEIYNLIGRMMQLELAET